MPKLAWHSTTSLLITVCIATAAASGCATFKPTPIDQIPFKERVHTQERDGIRVSVAVLSRDEARQAFDVKLEKRGIQPVWIKVENNTDKAFWFMMTGLDPNYFSAHEAAYMNHYFWGGKDNRAMDDYFDSLAINPLIPAGGRSEGFAFSNQRIGTKQVRVRLFGDRDVRDFEFFVDVPGFEVAWDVEAIFQTYTEDQLVHFTDEQEFLDAVATLPCCTSRSDGAAPRDPLNIVIVSHQALDESLVKAGWDAADSFLWESVRNYFGALKYDGRPPDLGVLKVRDTTHASIALILWITNLRFDGSFVWIGSISRDVDPDVDGARAYLGEDFLIAQVISALGYTTGVGVVSPDNPRKTAANMDYHTDGDRLVMGLSLEPVRFEDIDFYGVEERRARIRQRQSSTTRAPQDDDEPQ
jgi:hypothetical protein